MLIRYSYFVIAVILMMGVGACSKKEESPKQPIAPPSPPQEEAVTLQIKWQLGKQYQQTLELSQESDITTPFTKEPVKQTLYNRQETAVNVLHIHEDGQADLEFRFLRQAVDLKSPMMMLAFDSAQEESKDGGHPLASLYRRLMGASLRYTLSPQGQVSQVTGLKEMMNLVAGENPQTRMAMEQFLSERQITQMLENSNAENLPGKPVKPGDTWTLKKSMGVVGPLGEMEVTLKHVFTGWEKRDGKKCAHIQFEGQMMASANIPEGPAGIKISFDNARMQGSLWFDPVLGFVVRNETQMNMNVKTEMPNPVNPKEVMTLTAPTTHKITMTLDRIVDIPPEPKRKDATEASPAATEGDTPSIRLDLKTGSDSQGDQIAEPVPLTPTLDE